MIWITSCGFHALSSAMTGASTARATSARPSMPSTGCSKINDLGTGHAAEGADRLGRRGIALVGIDAQGDLRPHGVAHTQHHLDVTVGVDPDFDLEDANAFPGGLGDLALRLLESDQAD